MIHTIIINKLHGEFLIGKLHLNKIKSVNIIFTKIVSTHIMYMSRGYFESLNTLHCTVYMFIVVLNTTNEISSYCRLNSYHERNTTSIT
jgi:hypothetical protein